MSVRDILAGLLLGRPNGERDGIAAVTPQLGSPWATPEQLQAIIWNDAFGATTSVPTRASAMAVPAVARLRHLLTGIIARMPLVQLTGDVPDTTQPLWTQRTDGDLSPWHRMVWTVDDHLFYGWSLWAVRRGASTDGANPLAMARVPWSRWEVDRNTGQLLVDKQTVPADQAILLPGPHGGLLNDSATILAMAGDNLAAARNAARNPNPNIDLHYTGEKPMSPDDIDALIERWTTRRLSETGGVGFTNRLVEAKPMGAHDAQLLVEGRNADAVDIARAGSVPASLLDATSAGASLTYETTEGRNQQLLDYGAQLYMDAIAARLSQDDCAPRGKRIAFDTSQLTSLTPTPTGAPTSD